MTYEGANTNDPTEAINQRSSVELAINGKGEPSFRVKVYEGTAQESIDETATVAAKTIAGLVAGSYGSL